jgi:tRNA threonylcarbamoyladenosine biosynthesis protein TsaB
MVTLALDTSTPVGSVAVGRDGEVLAESLLRVRATHSEAVLPEVDRLLAACGLGSPDLHAVVVGGGPGSFTGVRIAASLAKGMCHARGLALFSFSSLAAVAAGTRCDGPVCALFDARRGQVYAAGYRVESGIEELFAPRAAALEQILEDLDEPGKWCFAGDGAGPGESAIRSAGGRILDPDTWVPRARSLLWLASVDPGGGRVADPGRWEPGYVRLPAAQRGFGG